MTEREAADFATMKSITYTKKHTTNGIFTMRHYSDIITNLKASQIPGVSIVYSAICSGADQRKEPSSASLAFVRRIHRWPVNVPHKGSVTQKMCPFDDVNMQYGLHMEITLALIYMMISQVSDNNLINKVTVRIAFTITIGNVTHDDIHFFVPCIE